MYYHELLEENKRAGERIKELESENRRYREALEKIAKEQPGEFLFLQFIELRKLARATLGCE